MQILLALGGLLVLAFAPLFVAIASLTRTTLQRTGEQAARTIAESIALHVAELPRDDRQKIARALRAHVGQRGIEAVCAVLPDRTLVCAGPQALALELDVASEKGGVAAAAKARRYVDVQAREGEVTAYVRLDVEFATSKSAALTRIVALYMGIFALGLLVFAYFAITRLIVRPIDALVRSADRVASGARALDVPRDGARELVELGRSLGVMTDRLVADEAAMRAKVAELTQTTKRLTEARMHLVRSERLASVGKLAAGVAHEIGNPIAALMGLEDLLIDGGLPEDEQRDFLQRMRSETDRIHTVVRQLLDFARPEGAQPGPTSSGETSDLAAVASEVLALLRPQKSFRTTRVDVAFPEGGLFVKMAHQPLGQVLVNLLLNAAFAISSREPPGGTIWLRGRVEGSQAIVEVEDDGPGVAEAIVPRVFDPFVTSKEVGEGTGLGLSVCRGLVEAAGGSIELDAGHEGGALFVVRLPHATDGGAAADAP